MKVEVIEKITALLTAAFGLVAALAWNDAIKGLFAQGGALESLATYGPWFYAIFVTLIAVYITIQLARISDRAKEIATKETIEKVKKTSKVVKKVSKNNTLKKTKK
jgi:hypothetical protein